MEPVDWSPDGKWIIYEHSNATSWGDLSCPPIAGGAPVDFIIGWPRLTNAR